MASSGFVSLSVPQVRRRTPLATQPSASQTRARDRAEAHGLKAGGGGADATATKSSVFGDIGGVLGTALGGPVGGAIGKGLGDMFGNERPMSNPGGTSNAKKELARSGGCPDGRIQMGTQCIDPLAGMPGGIPLSIPSAGTMVGHGGGAVIGAFGLPAQEPTLFSQLVRRCGPGMVLGEDDLCYPKAILPKRSQYRKWKGAVKPPVTAADMKAIRRANSTRNRVLDLAKDVGLHAAKSAPRRKK